MYEWKLRKILTRTQTTYLLKIFIIYFFEIFILKFKIIQKKKFQKNIILQLLEINMNCK